MLAEKYSHMWAEQQIIKPDNASLTMRAIAGMVLGLILEYIMGDKTLEAHWDELPDVLTNMLLDGLWSDHTHSK